MRDKVVSVMAFITLEGFAYLLVSFITLEINCTLWWMGYRLLYVILFCVIAAFCINEETKDQ